MGFFSWDLGCDKLYGDDIIGEIFDCSPSEMAEGVCINRIIDQIDPQDRQRIAKAIHTAIVTGDPYQEMYSVVRDKHVPVKVVALGRCLRSPDGVPSIYTGIVFAYGDGVRLGRDPLLMHAEAALDLAQKSGNELAARYFSSALRTLDTSRGLHS